METKTKKSNQPAVSTGIQVISTKLRVSSGIRAGASTSPNETGVGGGTSGGTG